MRDGIAAAKRSIPAVALVTDDFWQQCDFVALSFSMPDIPRVRLPHPIAGTGKEAMQQVAHAFVDEMVSALKAPNPCRGFFIHAEGSLSMLRALFLC